MSSGALRRLSRMSELRVHNFSISLDGFAAGPGQGPDTRLFDGLGGALDGWECAEFAASPAVAHVRLRPAGRGGTAL